MLICLRTLCCIYKALNLSKDLDHNGQNSWFSSVRHLCTILNLPADFVKLRKCKFTQLLNSSLGKSYLKLWEKNFKTVMEGKLLQNQNFLWVWEISTYIYIYIYIYLSIIWIHVKMSPLFFQNKNYFTKTPSLLYCQNGTLNFFFLLKRWYRVWYLVIQDLSSKFIYCIYMFILHQTTTNLYVRCFGNCVLSICLYFYFFLVTIKYRLILTEPRQLLLTN